MKLQDISIRNFRGIHSLDLPLDNLTVLIGENNVGKSTILEALRIVLARGLGFKQGSQFTEYDFHLKDADATPHTAKPISITLRFAEEEPDEWQDDITGQLSELIHVDITNGCNNIWLQAQGYYDSSNSSFITTCIFLNANQQEIRLKSSNPHNLLIKFVPLFFLSAIRNASQEFGQRGQFWSGFLKSIDLPDDKRKNIESMLQDINSSVIGANQGFSNVIQSISKAKNLVPLDDAEPVTLEAIPTRVFDMVGKVQVHLKSSYGAKLPLNRHGEGTQSLAVLMLFQAFTAAVLAETYTPHSVPLLALEEPEAHLHPSAIRSVKTLLDDLKNQIIVTSHSGDLISSVPITSLRRLYKKNGETLVGQVEKSDFDDKELDAIKYHVCFSRGHYLFSRCWFLVEGATESHLFPVLFEMLGYSQYELGFSIIEYSQVAGDGEPLIKLAKSLGIEWFLLADGDDAGNGYIENAKNQLASTEALSSRAIQFQCKSIEHEFWNNGYAKFIQKDITKKKIQGILQKNETNSEKLTQLYVDAAIKTAGGKPAFAQKLLAEIDERGIDTIPQSIKNIIEHVAKMCEEAKQ